MQYIAFLRGINVGKKQVKMDQLRQAFEGLGFTTVQTLLTSGNVIFTASESTASELTKKIEGHLEQVLGFEVEVVIRTASEIKRLVESQPFMEVSMTPQTRLYVTFLADAQERKLPKTTEKNFIILQITASEVLSKVELSAQYGTTEAMKVLEHEFGKRITTRSWNTIEKIAALLPN